MYFEGISSYVTNSIQDVVMSMSKLVGINVIQIIIFLDLHNYFPSHFFVFVFLFPASQQKAVQAIDAAMNQWTSLSCIQFVPRTTEIAYIEFFKGAG